MRRIFIPLVVIVMIVAVVSATDFNTRGGNLLMFGGNITNATIIEATGLLRTTNLSVSNAPAACSGSNYFLTFWNGTSATCVLATNVTSNSSELRWDGNSTLVYYRSNPLGFYNSSSLPATVYQSSAAGWTNTSTTTKTNLHANITGNLTVSGNCVFGSAGGSLCFNATCATLLSPDGGTKVEACN